MQVKWCRWVFSRLSHHLLFLFSFRRTFILCEEYPTSVSSLASAFLFKFFSETLAFNFASNFTCSGKVMIGFSAVRPLYLFPTELAKWHYALTALLLVISCSQPFRPTADQQSNREWPTRDLSDDFARHKMTYFKNKKKIGEEKKKKINDCGRWLYQELKGALRFFFISLLWGILIFPSSYDFLGMVVYKKTCKFWRKFPSQERFFLFVRTIDETAISAPERRTLKAYDGLDRELVSLGSQTEWSWMEDLRNRSVLAGSLAEGEIFSNFFAAKSE